MKRALAAVPTLRQVDQRRPFVLYVDASAFATGAVLLQDFGDGLCVCVFSYKAFTAKKLCSAISV